MPDEDAGGLAWLLFEQSGVLTSRQAAAELSRAAVRHLVVTGRWRRACRGVLVSGSGPLTREQGWWVAVLAAGRGGVAGRSGGRPCRWSAR